MKADIFLGGRACFIFRARAKLLITRNESCTQKIFMVRESGMSLDFYVLFRSLFFHLFHNTDYYGFPISSFINEFCLIMNFLLAR